MTSQSATIMHDVFISYAREDLFFTRRLKEAMEANGRKVWVDVEGAFGGEEFWPQIRDAIEKAKIFVFVVSPSSGSSHYCRQEISHAVHHNKRVVPVVCSVVDEQSVPDAIAARQWIFFHEEDSFDIAFAAFIDAIDTDLPWLVGHTQLLTQAIAWDNQGHDSSYVLRGRGLTEAEEFLSRSAHKEPKPTPLQAQFILASRSIATKRQRTMLGGVTLGLAVAVVLGGIAFYQYQLSEIRGQTARGRLLISQAASRLDTQLDLAILLSLEAHRVHPSARSQGSILSVLQHNDRLRTFLRGHTDKVDALVFSPDGKSLASGGGDQTILLWDLQTLAPRAPPLRGHAADIIEIAFSLDGQQLMSVDTEGIIIHWDLSAYESVAQADSKHPEGLITAAFDSKRNTLAMAGRFSITLWDVKTMTRKGERIYGPLAIVTGLAFSPDGRRLLSADSRTGIIEWDVETQQPVGDPIEAGAEVLSVAYGPDSKEMASATRWVTFWDLEQREPVGEPLRGHESNMTEIRFSPDGALLASGNLDSTVRLWDVESRTLFAVLHPGRDRGSVNTLAFSPNGEQLASSGRDGVIRLWNVQPRFAYHQVLEGHDGSVKSVVFSPDGSIIATGGTDGSVRLWDRKTGQSKGAPLRGHGDADVVALAFSPDSKRLVSGSIGWTSTIRLWDLDSGLTVGEPHAEHQVPNRPFGVFTLQFDPSGKRMASGGWDGLVRLWNGEEVAMQGKALNGHQGSVISLAFNPEGTRVASGGGNGVISFWDAETGNLVSQRMYEEEGNSVNGLAFSADGQHLISAHQNGTIIVSESASHKEIQQLPPHDDSKIYAFAVTPNRNWLASLNEAGSIWLWNLEEMERLDTPLRSANAVSYVAMPAWSSLAFSPDGKQLASAALGDSVLLWDVDPESWRDRACSRANRNLTQSEWDEFIGPDMTYQLTCPNLARSPP